MRAYVTDTKLAAETIQRTFDFNPWLQSIYATFASFTVANVSGVTLTSSAALGIVTVTAAGGSLGASYNVSVTCTSSSGLTRETVWQVTIAGARPQSTGNSSVDLSGVQASIDSITEVAADAADQASTALSQVSVKASIGAILPLAYRRRGMSVDDTIDSPRNDQYWPLARRFRPNVVRTFMRPFAATLGAPYQPGRNSVNAALTITVAQWVAVLLVDVGQAAAGGAQTILTMAPQRPASTFTAGGSGVREERNDPQWWQSASARQSFINLWVAIATLTVGNTDIWAFDTLNEGWASQLGQGFAQQDMLNALQDDVIDAVRAIDPTRTFIYSVGVQGPAAAYKWMKPSSRHDNVIYSVHMYQPFAISHAGVGFPFYTDTYPSVHAVGGGDGLWDSTKANRDRVMRELEPVIRFQQRYGVQIIVGEFGANAGNPVNVAADFIEDMVWAFEKLGWHWVFHSFTFLPIQFAALDMPFATTLINNDDGINGVLQVPLNQATGAVHQARAPIVAPANAMRQNVLWRQSENPTPAFTAMEDFEIAPSDRTATGALAWLNIEQSGAAHLIDLQSTANPYSGTKAMRAQHVGAGGAQARIAINSQSLDPDSYFSANVCIGKRPGANWTLISIPYSYNSASDDCFFTLGYDTNPDLGWYIDSWPGSDGVRSFGGRPLYSIPHFTFTPGVYFKLYLHLMSDWQRGRFRVWQDLYDGAGPRALIDVNTAPTVKVQGNTLTQIRIGYDGYDVGQTVDIDNIRLCRGTGECDIT